MNKLFARKELKLIATIQYSEIEIPFPSLFADPDTIVLNQFMAISI